MDNIDLLYNLTIDDMMEDYLKKQAFKMAKDDFKKSIEESFEICGEDFITKKELLSLMIDGLHEIESEDDK